MRPSVSQQYDAWHAQHSVDEGAEAPWHALAKEKLSGLGGERVLEVACGRGGFAAYLAQLPESQRPAQIVAADFSPIAIEKAWAYGKSLQLTNVEYRVADLMELPFETGSFDTAISFETIEHVPSSQRALRELSRVLRPGGRLYLTFPNYLNLQGLHRVYRSLTRRPLTEGGQPINHPLVLPRVVQWLRDADLRIESIWGVGHYVPFPRRPAIRLRALDRLPLTRYAAAHPLVLARK
ncbi:MAG: methyltransferase domain-containing protein [Myxococcaceae bacterium]